MKQLDLENFECNIGLMLREKDNHDNYVLLRFEDLEKMIEYYESFKKEFSQKTKSGQNKKMEKSE
ncbi:MAG: hypothetical protein HOE10_07590 [Deltaproteobacteria bacterium]|jgi:hypothetical protein|nr:hypothetical protein [Deltaproteobacteria bacterium]